MLSREKRPPAPKVISSKTGDSADAFSGSTLQLAHQALVPGDRSTHDARSYH